MPYVILEKLSALRKAVGEIGLTAKIRQNKTKKVN